MRLENRCFAGRTTDSGAWRRVSRPIAGDASASRAAKAGCEGRPGGSGGPGSRGGCRLQVREACGLCELEGAQQVALAACELGALLAGAGGAGERAEVQALKLVAHVAPGVAGLVLDDPDQQQREPAEQDVRADAVFAAVMDGA